MSCAFIFPGQGSQKVGMGAALISGYKTGVETMEEIEDAISFKISRLISEGPIEELTKTQNAQPAIFAIGMVCLRVLENEFGFDTKKNVKYLAGHSLGEYTALCAAGVLTVSDCAKLVRYRGELMSRAFSDSSDCAMAAILGVSINDLEDMVAPYADGRRICVIANDNSPAQVVVSGHKDIVTTVCEKAKKERGALRSVMLNTSGPFHSPLMAKAAIEFDRYLVEHFEFSDFKLPVIMNVSAQPLCDKSEVHSYLVRQITSRVRWRETIDLIANDQEIDKVIEIAPGRVLTAMAKRTYPDKNFDNIETVAQIEEFMKG